MFRQRMFGMVVYSLSGIQKAIQFGHGVVEYANKYFSYNNYQQWAQNDKTFIILDGGTTNRDEQSEYFGSLNMIPKQLEVYNIDYATFCEPDLGNQLTSVVFLVDERVWNKKDYPDFYEYMLINSNLNNFDRTNFKYLDNKSCSIIYPEQYKNWLELIGGETNAFLKEYLKQFKLASN